MRVIVTEYPVWNLWIQRPIELGEYAFTPAGGRDGYQEHIRRLLASPDDELTVMVRREVPEGTLAPPAVLWDSGTLLDDCMTLLSFGQGRSVHYREARWELRDGEKVLATGEDPWYVGRALARGERAISPFEVEGFLAGALETIHQPEWVRDTGFGAVVGWYLQSISVSNIEVRFLSAWWALETLFVCSLGSSLPPQRDWLDSPLLVGSPTFGEAHPEGGESSAEGRKRLLGRFRSVKGWEYLTDDLIELWTEIQVDYLQRPPPERIFTARQVYIAARKLQLGLLLALLDMVGTSDFARRESVLRDIRR